MIYFPSLLDPDISSVEGSPLFLKQISESQNEVAFHDVMSPACAPGGSGLISREATGWVSGHLSQQTPIAQLSQSARTLI
jgi:hypothetical protein